MFRQLLHANFDWLITPRDRILSAISQDGVKWEREPGVRIDVGKGFNSQMAYYQFVHRPDDLSGLWEMFYQGANKKGGQWTNHIYTATSKDGLNWVENTQPVLRDGDNDFVNSQIRGPFLMDFGSFWRMYFSARGADGVFRILSGVSRDRKTWSIESGTRISPEQLPKGAAPVSGVSDTAIIRMPSGEFRMYFTVFRQSEWFQEICSAVSIDGRDWQLDPGVRISHGQEGYCTIANNPSVTQMQGGYRMYFRGGDLLPLWNNIFTAVSKNGLQWEIEGISLEYRRCHRYERHAVAFPYVLPIDNDRYRMYYTGYWGHILDGPIIRRYLKKASALEIPNCKSQQGASIRTSSV